MKFCIIYNTDVFHLWLWFHKFRINTFEMVRKTIFHVKKRNAGNLYKLYQVGGKVNPIHESTSIYSNLKIFCTANVTCANYLW